MPAKANRGIFLAALLVIVSAPVMAQSTGTGAGTSTPPGRIDNHYNHKAYQPSMADICDRPNSGGINCPSPAGRKAVATLDSVRRQLDDLAKEYPPDPTLGVR